MARPRAPTLIRSGGELRAWRRALFLTQADLARKLGVSERAICGYERGEWPLPPLLPWALLGIQKSLRSQLRYEAKERRRNWVRRERYREQKALAAQEPREAARASPRVVCAPHERIRRLERWAADERARSAAYYPVNRSGV